MDSQRSSHFQTVYRGSHACTPKLVMVSIVLILTSLVSLAAISAGAQTRPAFLGHQVSYLWPTNASYYMSSSFGETRSAHFHAAMDIGTWGHEGYPVFATRDGRVQRIGIGPVGYGNVIYLQHDDESISLYAHLKDFHPLIRSKVDSLRMQDYSFTFDRNMEDFQMDFQKGDLIGWSGSTGVGPPHLHFELRTPDGTPFNPLLAGIRIEDSIPPQFSEIAIEPLSALTRIDDKIGTQRFRPVRRDGEYDFGTITASGEIGLAVDVFDRADGSNNVHAVYELEMQVNGDVFFHSRIDSFSYGQTRQMFIDRIYSILNQERKGFQRLYVRNGNTLPFYLDTGHSGRLSLPPGNHQIRILASDYFGNQSAANLNLQVIEPDSNTGLQKLSMPLPERSLITTPDAINRNRPAYASKQSKRTTSTEELSDKNYIIPKNLYWHKNWVNSTDDQNQIDPITDNKASFRPYPEELFLIRLLGSFKKERLGYASVNRGLPLDKSDRKKLVAEGGSWILHRIEPGHPVSVYHDNMRVGIHFPAEAVYSATSIGIAGDHSAFTLFPDSEPFNQPAAVRILLDEKTADTNGIGLYQIHHRTGKPQYVSSHIDTQSNTLIAELDRGGDYILMTDSLGPEISKPEFGQWQHNKQHYVTVAVVDDLSGIDHQSAIFIVNGERGIAEYDPEKNLFRYHHPQWEPKTRNDIRVEIHDKAGNATQKHFENVPAY